MGGLGLGVGFGFKIEVGIVIPLVTFTLEGGVGFLYLRQIKLFEY